MAEMPWQNPLELSIYTYFKKRKGRREKQVFSAAGYQWEGGHKERVSKGEHTGYIVYSFMKIEGNLQKLFQERGGEEQEHWTG
jgi:hypothetical protein